MKTFNLLIARMLFFVMIAVSIFACTKDDTEDVTAPPALGIVTQNPDGTYGDLTIKPFIEKESNTTVAAPWPTTVILYKNQANYDKDIREYDTYTYKNDSIYFGFLKPEADYIVTANCKTSDGEYSAVSSITIYKGIRRTISLILKKVSTTGQK